MDINIIVRNKIARLVDPIVAVCGNSDYVVKFDFDSEWDAFENKTARFKHNGEYTDIIFTGNECSMPVIKNAYRVEIGVYAGNLHTTTPAFLIMKKSITSDGGTPAAPAPDVYDQLMQRMNEIEAPDAILYAEQSLTDKQKAQARDNIGAAKDNAVVYLQDSVTPTKLVQAIIENPKSIIECVFKFSGDAPVSQMTFLPIYKHYRGSGENYYLGYAIGNYDIQNSKNMPFDVYKYDARDDMGSYTIFLTPMHANKSILDSITGIVTANKLTSPDHPTDLVAYEAFQAAVPRVQQMNISGASVGQTIKVKTVDANGCPTSWEAADMVSGSEEVWEKVAELTVAEDVTQVDFSPNNLNRYTKLMLEFNMNHSSTYSGLLNVNGRNASYFALWRFDYGAYLNQYGQILLSPSGIPEAPTVIQGWQRNNQKQQTISSNTIRAGSGALATARLLYNFESVFPCTTIHIYHGGTIVAGSLFILWGCK